MMPYHLNYYLVQIKMGTQNIGGDFSLPISSSLNKNILTYDVYYEKYTNYFLLTINKIDINIDEVILWVLMNSQEKFLYNDGIFWFKSKIDALTLKIKFGGN